jgi:hypothetical protein
MIPAFDDRAVVDASTDSHDSERRCDRATLTAGLDRAPEVTPV